MAVMVKIAGVCVFCDSNMQTTVNISGQTAEYLPIMLKRLETEKKSTER